MKNAYIVIVLVGLLTLTNSSNEITHLELTLQQSVTLDLRNLRCSDLDDINIMIADIIEWKDAIDLNGQLEEDLNGLLEVEKIVKATQKSLSHKSNFIELENSMMNQREVQTKVEESINKIMMLMKQINQKQTKKEKIALLDEIDVCIQATKKKLQSILKQTEHATNQDVQILTSNLQQLLYIKQKCQQQQLFREYDPYDENQYEYDDYYEVQYEEEPEQQYRQISKIRVKKQISEPTEELEQEQEQQDYYEEQEEKQFDALDPDNQYNVIQDTHIYEQEQQNNYEEQQQDLQPIEDQEQQRLISVSHDDHDYQKDLEYQQYQERRENPDNQDQQTDDQQYMDSEVDYQQADIITDSVKLDDDSSSQSIEAPAQPNESVQTVQPSQPPGSEKTEQPLQQAQAQQPKQPSQSEQPQSQKPVQPQQPEQSQQNTEQQVKSGSTTDQPVINKTSDHMSVDSKNSGKIEVPAAIPDGLKQQTTEFKLTDQQQQGQQQQQTQNQQQQQSTQPIQQGQTQQIPQVQQQQPIPQPQAQSPLPIQPVEQPQAKQQSNEQPLTQQTTVQQLQAQNVQQPVVQAPVAQPQGAPDPQPQLGNQPVEQPQVKPEAKPQVENPPVSQPQTVPQVANNPESQPQQAQPQIVEQPKPQVAGEPVTEQKSTQPKDLPLEQQPANQQQSQQQPEQTQQSLQNQQTQQQPTEQTQSQQQKPTDLVPDTSTSVVPQQNENPDQLIDPVRFVPFKHKPLQSTANVLVRQSKFYDSTTEGQPAYQVQFSNKELQDSEEYGYGYWMKYQSTLESKMKPTQYHFLSRLTSLKDYLDFQNYGDRTLANFLFDSTFVFATYDYVAREKNKVAQITLNQNIDGRWYFISFSYSSRKQIAVGFVLTYGKGRESQRIEIPCTHGPPFYMSLTVGGRHLHYPGLQGQFANIFYDVEAPALIENQEQLQLVIETMSFMPQGLKTYHEEIIAGPPVDLDGNAVSSLEKGFKDAFIYEQYAISGWFRWTDNLDVKELNSFQIMNLRSNKVRGKQRELGDRSLEIHFIRGLQNIGINFHTYSVEGNQGKGSDLIVKQVPYTVNLWTYVYFGFNQDEKKAFGVMIRVGVNEEVLFDNIEHRHTNALYFTLGGDQQVASFNGRVSQIGVYLGPEAFVTRRKMDYMFGYGDGAVNLFQLVKPLILRSQQDTYEISFDQEQPLINQILIQDDKNIKINGLSEYSVGLWTCWLSSEPKFIGNRAELHQVIRMGTRAKLLELQDNKLVQVEQGSDIRDTTLQIRVAKKEYEFSTYHIVSSDIKKAVVPLDSQLEGSWNYLYFSYKRMNNMGLAKGYVQFGIGGEVKECQVEVLHDYLQQYVELNVGKSNIQQFNGKIANVQMRLGLGAFLVDAKQYLQFQQLEKPPQGAGTVSRKSVQLLGSEVDMSTVGETSNIYEYAQYAGVGEYALSGWVKWGGDQKQGGLFNVVMMIQKRLSDIKQGQSDAQLYIQRTDKDFIFGTYSCSGEDCTPQFEKNLEFNEYYNLWTFIYVGYSQKAKKLFAICKFTFTQQQFSQENVNRILLSTFTVYLGKKYQLANQWLGQLKQWVLNVGDGSYVESGYEQNETVELYFGFNSGTDHLKLQSANQVIDHSEKIIDSQADKPTIPWMIELDEKSDTKIEGVTSYGYGMWARFRFYGTSILYNQPKWMGITRLTTNRDYRDADQVGDRVLMILFGKTDVASIYQFCTYSSGQPSVFANAQFRIEYESEWVYLYYSYKRISQTQGMAIGFVGRLDIVEDVKIEAQHSPVSNYLLFTVGHSGKYYPNFNGQFTGIKFRLGNGAYIDNKNDILQAMRNTDLMPSLPYDDSHKYTIVDGKIDNFKTIPNNPQMIDFATNEYSVALWYKYPLKISGDRETVFRLTQNPVGKVTDMSWVGDRTLSLFKVDKDNVEFSTYTLMKSMNFGIPYNCQIPELSQHAWTFIYMGYSKKLMKLYYYLSVDEYICKSEEQILHAISDRMWIYVGSDNLQQRFEGNLAQVALTIGPGSFTNNKIPFLPEYLVADKLFPKQKKITWEKNDEILITSNGDESTSSMKVELFNGFQYPFDQMTEYAFGMWTRYLTTIPERQLTKPPLMQVGRLSINKDFTDGVINVGDRVLAMHLVFNYYQISTYDLNTDTGVQQKFIKYNQLEGVWRYIYMGYNKEIETVSCYTYDTVTSEMKIDKILHKPLTTYISFHVGKDGAVPGFQGMIAKMMVALGPGSYIRQQDQFKSQIDTTFSLPFQLTQEYTDKEKHGKFEIIEDVNQIDITNGIQFEGTRWSGISEYSFSGWIKSSGQLNNDCQLLLRLTNNNRDTIQDRKSQGDRTLFASLCNSQLIKFSTYTLIDLKDANEPKFVDGQVELGDYNYAWNYIYMGYNYRTNEVHCLLHTLVEDKPLTWSSILHYVPNYLGLYIGQDKFTPKFVGQMNKWTAAYGLGAFVSLKRNGYQQALPYYTLKQANKQFQWNSNKDTVMQTPDLIVQEFTNEIDSITEYAFGVWTRWLTDFPDHLIERKDSYSIFRLTANKDHQDKSALQDRVLSSFLMKGSYDFSSYDASTNNFAVSNLAAYEQIEGAWNFVYMAYKGNKAVGIVILKDTAKALKVEFSVKHIPLVGYAKLLVSVPEFGHGQFHGWLFDPRLYLGEGAYIGESQKVVDLLQKIHRKLPLPVVDLADFKWAIPQMDTTENIKTGYLDYKFLDKSEAVEYSYGMWVQQSTLLPGMPVVPRLIARLTTNHPQFMKDSTLGDRTLLVSVQNDKLSYSTYKLLDTPLFENKVQELQFEALQWTYIFFQYKKGTALAYSLEVKAPQFKSIDALHIVPNVFYFYLIKDQNFPDFYGKVSDVKVFFGASSYFDDPQVTIDKWPFDKKYLIPGPEQPIQNQQITSAKIARNMDIKNEKYSGDY